METRHQSPHLKEKEPKACWYPFKKAYERRRIQPGGSPRRASFNSNSNSNSNQIYQDPPNVYYFNERHGRTRKQVEVAVYEYDETGSQQQAGETELVLEGHPTPMELLDLPPSLLEEMENNSLVSEEEMLRQQQIREKMQENDGLASINPNCMSKEFWVDEMVEGGSLACMEDFLPNMSHGGGRSLARSSNDSIGNSTNWSGESKNLRLSSGQSISSLPGNASNTKARIEIEYDFVKRDQQSRGKTPLPNQPQAEIIEHTVSGGRGKPRRVKIEPTKRANASATSNDLSTFGSNDDGMETLNTTATSHSTQDASQSQSPTQPLSRKTDPVSPEKPKSMTKRVMCVARPFRRRKKDKGKMGGKGTQKETPLPEPEQVTPEEESNDLVEETLPADTSADSSWLDGTALSQNALALRNAILATKACTDPNTSQKLTLPRHHQHQENHNFYVEVEATRKQLKGVRDLEEIRDEEKTVPAAIATTKDLPLLLAKDVAMARSSSLVDEDSAFMEPQCMPVVMQRLTPSRQKKKADLFDEYRKRWPDQPLGPIPTTTGPEPIVRSKSETRTTTPKRSRSQPRERSHKTLEPHVVPYTPDEMDELAALKPEREGRMEDQDVYDSRDFMRRSSPPKDDSEPYSSHRGPSLHRNRSRERTRSAGHRGKEEDELILKSQADSDTYDTSNSPWRNKVAAKRRQRAKSIGNVTMNKLHGIPVPASPTPTEVSRDIDDMTTEIGEGFGPEDTVDPNHGKDYELARFPSLTTEDWNQAGIGANSPVNRASGGAGTSADYDAAWLRSGEVQRYAHANDATQRGHEGGDAYLGRETWDEIHGIQRAPSLDESFDNALLEEKDMAAPSYLPKEFQMSHSRSQKEVIMSPQRSQGAPFSSWADNEDDEDDSELNTEAFRKLAVEQDEDSIFYGLGAASPLRPLGKHRGSSFRKQYAEKTKAATSKMRHNTSLEESSRGSIYSSDSEQSPERSRYPSRMHGEASVLSGDELSRYSKVSKFSRFSRGDLTFNTFTTDAYSVEEPFNCMDRWLG